MSWILGVALAVTLILVGAPSSTHANATGQEAFCINASHGQGGWSGECRETGKEARADADEHVKKNPTHKEDTTTRSCDL
jgi:hypothetical protein